MSQHRYTLSAHAQRRCQQRGVNFETLKMVVEEADVDIPVGSGAFALSISQYRQRHLIKNGAAPQIVEKAANICVVETGGRIKTVLHDQGRRGRRYRRSV